MTNLKVSLLSLCLSRKGVFRIFASGLESSFRPLKGRTAAIGRGSSWGSAPFAMMPMSGTGRVDVVFVVVVAVGVLSPKRDLQIISKSCVGGGIGSIALGTTRSSTQVSSGG